MDSRGDSGEWRRVQGRSARRLDQFLAEEMGWTRSYAKQRIDAEDVLRAEKTLKASDKVENGDLLEVWVPAPQEYDLKGEDIPLDVVYEDGDLIVVNKGKDMVVHPAPGHQSGTLVNALMYHVKDLSGIGGELRPGIVHRIDKDTTGLLLVCKNDMAHQSLSEQLKEKTASRRYFALVEGNIKEDELRIDAPIGRSLKDRKKMAVRLDGHGREAATQLWVLERFGSHSYVECALETGRTHQIRVHLAYKKHPVAGDVLYGHVDSKLGLYSQALHAHALAFVHPRTGEHIELEAPIPPELENALTKLRGTQARQRI